MLNIIMPLSQFCKTFCDFNKNLRTRGQESNPERENSWIPGDAVEKEVFSSSSEQFFLLPYEKIEG